METIENNVEELRNDLDENSTNDDENFNPLEGFTGEEIRNPIKAIRSYCVKECSSGMSSETKHCVITSCKFFPFRMGKNPYRSREMTEEQRQALSERGKRLGASRKKIEIVMDNKPMLRL